MQVCIVSSWSLHSDLVTFYQARSGCNNSWASTSPAISEHYLFSLPSLFDPVRFSLPLVLQNSVGLSNSLSRLLAACNSVSYLVFSFLGLLLIERVGRRKMMMWGAAGQCVCYIFIAALLSQAGAVNGSRFGAGATAFFFIYYIFFGVCWQVSYPFNIYLRFKTLLRKGVPWLYPTEINSLSMRTYGAALGTGSNWYVIAAICIEC